MPKSGWVIRKAWVAECGNCGAWSAPYRDMIYAEDAEGFREVDGVAMCGECADDIEDE